MPSCPSTPKPENSIRIVCYSDTHGKYNTIPPEFSNIEGDIALFAGDMSNKLHENDLRSFQKWFLALPCQYKIFIAGNHEFLPREKILNDPNPFLKPVVSTVPYIINDPNIIYLENSHTKILGIKIFGSPLSMSFYRRDPESVRFKYMDLIEADTDIFLVHGPPYQILDRTYKNICAGSKILKNKIDKIKPSLVVFGHIHEAYGVLNIGQTLYVNASLCNKKKRIINPPVVVDMIPTNREIN